MTYKNPKEFLRALYQSVFSPEIKSLLWLVILVIIVGTVFYKLVEGWGWLDSYYFSVMTLTTVGYGDLAPVTGLGKFFTTIYVLASLGIVFTFVSTLARQQTNRPMFKNLFNKDKNKHNK